KGEGDPVAVDAHVAQRLAEQAAARKAHRPGGPAGAGSEIEGDPGLALLVAHPPGPMSFEPGRRLGAAEQPEQGDEGNCAHQAVQRKPPNRRRCEARIAAMAPGCGVESHSPRTNVPPRRIPSARGAM